MSELPQSDKRRPNVVIDIETMPDMRVVSLLPEPDIATGNLKDPEKIAAKVKAAKDAQLEKMALSPLTGKIACIGIVTENERQALISDDEAEMLNSVYGLLTTSHIITFNGKSFDLPFIFKRAMIYGLPWASIHSMKDFCDKYKSTWHTDIMQEFCEYGQYEKLDTLARFLLGEKKSDFDVKQIPTLMQTKEGKDAIAKYCLHDCDLTWRLADCMGALI